MLVFSLNNKQRSMEFFQNRQKMMLSCEISLGVDGTMMSQLRLQKLSKLLQIMFQRHSTKYYKIKGVRRCRKSTNVGKNFCITLNFHFHFSQYHKQKLEQHFLQHTPIPINVIHLKAKPHCPLVHKAIVDCCQGTQHT